MYVMVWMVLRLHKRPKRYIYNDLDDFEIGNATRKLGDSYRLVYGGTTYRNLEEEYDALYELCKSSDNVDFNIQIHTNKFQYLNNDKKFLMSETQGPEICFYLWIKKDSKVPKSAPNVSTISNFVILAHFLCIENC